MTPSPRYVLREMHYEDIPQVVAIDRQSFPIPWSASVYRYELGQNSLSTMIVVSLYDSAGRLRESASLLGRILHRLRNGRHDPGWHRVVVGYGGFWFSGGEAHVSTIATHPDYRRRGLGELLLAGMIRRALEIQAREISLEVRVSNEPAIALYTKYGFRPAGIKPRYYRDNHEDAYDMRVTVTPDFRAMMTARWQALARRVPFVDQLTAHTPA
ncbi:MAG: ribosomal protein S18-alanine N-acetyltransferase [Anaerolineae bacterium]